MSRTSFSFALVRPIAAGVVLLLVVPRGSAEDVMKVLSAERATAVCCVPEAKQVVWNHAFFDEFRATDTSTLRVRKLDADRVESSPDPLVKRGGRGGVTSLAVSPDNRTWATLFNGKVQLWDPQTM